MDWNRIEGNWKQMKGKVKEKWGKLTDDELDQIAGRRDQLEGKIQERYGIAKDQVGRDIDDWFPHTQVGSGPLNPAGTAASNSKRPNGSSHTTSLSNAVQRWSLSALGRCEAKRM
jgi:uncharacterized protein YjbJ (UPF0337 family)